MERRITGGCQCGAVRYAISGALTNAHVCHCRMCQKASGNAFMALSNAQKAEFAVTRGEISWFQSSSMARRGFCRDCGTPLIYEGLKARHLNVTIGSLDDPEIAPPATQLGIEGRLAWAAGVCGLPEETTDEGFTPKSLREVQASNRQHPDHDTVGWPPADQSRRSE